MASGLAKYAQELLGLENLYRQGGMDQEQTAEWRDLVQKIFGPDDVKRRRSFRLPAEVQASVRIAGGTMKCSLVQASRIGLTMMGAIFSYVTHEDSLDIISVNVNGEDRQVDLKCEIVRVYANKRPPMAGVTISRENPAEVRQRYFEQVYYPLYLRYLEHLAAT